MTPYDLMERLGGEIVRGQIRYRSGQEYIVLARRNGDMMELTEAGRQALAELADAMSKPKRTKVDIDDLRPLPPESS